MLLSPQRKLLLSLNSNSGRVIFMGSKHLCLLKCTLKPPPFSSSQARFLQIRREIMFSAFSPKPLAPIYHRASGYSYTPHAALPIPRPISSGDLETLDIADKKQLMMLRQKLDEIGIDGSAVKPGQYNGLICPHCKGGDSREKSLSVHITKDGDAAMWTCFRAKCGWRGTTRALADVKSTYAKMSKITTVKQPIREITEESLQLEPLCNEVVVGCKIQQII